MKREKEIIDYTLDGIAGTRPPVYQGGISGSSEFSDEMSRLIRGAKTDELSLAQLDHLKRLAAGLLAGIRRVEMRRAGVKATTWDYNKGPGTIKRPYGREASQVHRGWMDHGKILKQKDRAPIYLSEPYDIGAEELRALVSLLDEGWKVWIDAHQTIHFPGSTSGVCIQEASHV